jgi:hypothetical protein
MSLLDSAARRRQTGVLVRVSRLIALATVIGRTTGCTPAAEHPAVELSQSGTAVAVCDRSLYDLHTESAAIGQTRAKLPDLTSDLAAFAVSLLPNDFFNRAAVTVNVGPTPNGGSVYADGASRILLSDADVAPAEFAHDIMQAVTLMVLVRGGTALDAAVPVANTVAADTYIRLLTARPDVARGPHARGRTFAAHVLSRLRGQNTFTRDSVSPDLFAHVPGYLSVLGSYFGPEYYHSDPASDLRKSGQRCV